MLRRKLFVAALVLLFSVFVAGSALAASTLKYKNKNDVPRITVPELKAKLSSGAEIYVLDIRTGASYDRSPLRIPGDIRSMFGELKYKTKDIPRGAEIAVYCT